SCLITGMYATSLGTQRLRSAFPVPADVKPFTVPLREAGYYCTNNVKTDYNMRDEQDFIRRAWDESSNKAHWRGKRDGQPFFAVFNFMTTHQSRTSAWSHEEFEKEIGSKLSMGERHDPAHMTPPPFYPDTPGAKQAWARYHDCITLMDRQAGEILDQLAADGLAEDTIVFFYADHGMGMPRGKRCLQDSGLRVPLIIRFPKKWAHLAPANPGSASDQIVSFVDFAPTVLSLCGVKKLTQFQGTAFLGTDAGKPREFVYGARDRVDEAFDVSRSVRDGRWLYIRNFMPQLPWMQWERYSDQSDFRREFLRLAEQDTLNAAQMTYAGSPRAPEELYDVLNDPNQLHNLAGRKAYHAELVRLRGALCDWMVETRDLGLLPEAEAWDITAGTTPREWALAQEQCPTSALLGAATLAESQQPFSAMREDLGSPDPAIRYWTTMALANRGTAAAETGRLLRRALQDEAPSVRILAAGAVCRNGDTEAGLPVLKRELENDDVNAVLLAARTLELLGEGARPLLPLMEQVLALAGNKESEHPNWMFVRFALEEATERLAGGTSAGSGP
ncbi:MAG: sulfatase-like hydrolase/transferase, partial [Verrucomicrobiae bacterium]|nr:sulfatase-like hydrolase/transferase [Verrucomicrobiae bacterium]